MSTKFEKSFFAFSFLASLVSLSAAANAGATISDKRSWPNEVGPATYRGAAQHAPRDAFAASVRTKSPVGAAASGEGTNGWRYIGGPKSSVSPSRGY